jgi:hypothetical protein
MAHDTAEQLVEVTRNGSISDWKERILQLVASIGVDLRDFDSGGDIVSVASGLVRHVRTQYLPEFGQRLDAKVTLLAAQQQALQDPAPEKVIRKSATVKRIGTGSQGVFILALNHLREPGESKGPSLRGAAGKTEVLTASSAVSQVLPLLQPEDSVTVAYVEFADGIVAGVILELDAAELLKNDE